MLHRINEQTSRTGKYAGKLPIGCTVPYVREREKERERSGENPHWADLEPKWENLNDVNYPRMVRGHRDEDAVIFQISSFNNDKTWERMNHSSLVGRIILLTSLLYESRIVGSPKLMTQQGGLIPL